MPEKTLPGEVRKDAVLSECGMYRYTLTRVWDESRPMLCIVMLNPSKADAEQNDPTIHSCTRIARHHGYGGFIVVNLYAYRATDPADLKRAIRSGKDAVGPQNDHHIALAIAGRDVVLAWGANASVGGRHRTVTALVQAAGRPCFRLGPLTKGGFPGHPLFLSPSVPMIPFPEKPHA